MRAAAWLRGEEASWEVAAAAKRAPQYLNRSLATATTMTTNQHQQRRCVTTERMDVQHW